jgi:hypothetical protein
MPRLRQKNATPGGDASCVSVCKFFKGSRKLIQPIRVRLSASGLKMPGNTNFASAPYVYAMARQSQKKGRHRCLSGRDEHKEGFQSF